MTQVVQSTTPSYLRRVRGVDGSQNGAVDFGEALVNCYELKKEQMKKIRQQKTPPAR